MINSVTRLATTLGVFNSYLTLDDSTTTAATPCTLHTKDGSWVDITYEPSTDRIKFVATVKKESYLGVGYGSSMKGTDLVVWQSPAANDPTEASQIECYAIGNTLPRTVTNLYNTTTFDSEASNSNVFTSYRYVQSSGRESYTIPLD